MSMIIQKCDLNRELQLQKFDTRYIKNIIQKLNKLGHYIDRYVKICRHNKKCYDITYF